jgi:hypothetical protein
MQPKKITLHSAYSIYPLIVTHGKWYIQQVLMISNNMMLKCIDCFNIQQLSETLNVILIMNRELDAHFLPVGT